MNQGAKANGRGFGLIETVVGAAIIVVVLLGLSTLGQYTFRMVDESNFRIRAGFLAEEGIEAARSMRDASWTANIASLALGTDYSLVFSSGVWQTTATPQALIDGVFTRTLQLAAVNRDSLDVITSSGGTLDPNAKRVTVQVAWSNRGRTGSMMIQTYMTNLFKN